jgi:hypothetical protein
MALSSTQNETMSIDNPADLVVNSTPNPVVNPLLDPVVNFN